MKRVRWWETPMAEIIYSYSEAAVALRRFQSKSTPNFPDDPVAIRQKIAASLVFGYEQCKAIATEPPMGNPLEEAQYNAYVAATSALFMLVNNLYLLAPWMSGPSTNHILEATEFSNRMPKDVMQWLMFGRDFPRFRKKDIVTFTELCGRMLKSSLAQSKAIRGVMETWGEPLEYDQPSTG